MQFLHDGKLKYKYSYIALPSLPSGLINPNCINFIGNGVVLHVPGFFDELDALVKKGGVQIFFYAFYERGD